MPGPGVELPGVVSRDLRHLLAVGIGAGPVIQGVVTAGSLLVQVGVLGGELQQGGEVRDRLRVAPERWRDLPRALRASRWPGCSCSTQVASTTASAHGRSGSRPGPQAANLEVVGAESSCDRQSGERVPKAPVLVRQGPEPGVGIGVEGIDPPGDGRLVSSHRRSFAASLARSG